MQQSEVNTKNGQEQPPNPNVTNRVGAPIGGAGLGTSEIAEATFGLV